MNKSKVIITALISVLSVFSFVSCGEDTESSNISGDTSSAVTSKTDNSTPEVTTADSTSVVNDSSEIDNYVKETVDIDCHYELPKVFDRKNKGGYILYPYHSTQNEMRFFAVPGICNEYNNLTVDINAPDTWLNTIKDTLTEYLGKSLEYTLRDSMIIIENEEQVEIGERTFIKFTGSFHDYKKDKDVTAVGYLTVIKGDPNLSEYKEDNTVGFITTDYSENADLEVLDGHSRHAAETLTIGD